MTNLQQKIPFWKKHVFLAIAFFIFSVLSATIANAQINNNRFRININSQDMGPCGGANDAYTRVGVIAKNNSVHNFEIAFDLPDGVSYIPGDLAILNQSGSGDFVLTEVDITNLNAPVFRLQRPGDANWQVADVVRFQFKKTASCEAVQFSYNGGLFKDAHTITYNDLNGSQAVSDNDPTINSYNFFRAYLAVLNYNNVNAGIGDNVSRPVEITNSGNGTITSFTHNVIVGNDLSSYSLSFNGNPLTPTNISGNTYTYTIDATIISQVGNGNTILENETIHFEEAFSVDRCGDHDIGHQPTWGCNATEICQLLEPVSAAVNINTEIPKISVTEISSFTNSDLCGPVTYTVRLRNDAPTANAYNVKINTGFGYSISVLTTDTKNGMWGNDIADNGKFLANFRFGSNPPFLPPQRPSTEYTNTGAGSYFIHNTLFTSDPDGPGGLEDLDGDGFYDDMAPGASTDLSYDYENAANTVACGTDYQTYISGTALFTDAYAQNQCEVSGETDRFQLNSTILYRKASTTNTPTDIYDGIGFTIGINGGMRAGYTDPPHCNGQKMFSNDPSSSWTVTLNVPTGILLNGSPAGYSQPNPNTVIYTTTDLPDVYDLDMNVDFPLVLDCASYSGAKNMAITYTTSYACSCFSQDIYCGSVGLRAQCPVACDGPAITSFDAQRETAGWTDNTMTTKVVLDPNVHNLNTYMAKDEMVLRTSAVMSNANPNNLFFDLDYETLSAATGGPDIIQFLNGTITVNDVSSGSQTVPMKIVPTLTTNGSTTHKLTFDLSSYTTVISPTYTYGEPTPPSSTLEPDMVDLELHFVFKEDFGVSSSVYELGNLRGHFYDENNASCNVIGDRAYYFKSNVNPYDRPSTDTEGCTETYIELRIQTKSPTDQFPGEYRPPAIWQSTDLEIPVGAEFTGLVTSYDFPGTDPTTTNGGLSVSQAGNVLTISPVAGVPSPGIKEYDQGGSHTPRIYVYFRGGSTSPPTSTVNWTSNYTEYAYSTAPEDKSDTDSLPFNFSQPNFSLTSSTPIVSGDQATATFEVDLCMDSRSDIDFNWLQINNGTSFTVINAVEVVGTVENPLTISENGGKTWVQLDSYTSGTSVCKKIRFELNYTQCTNFDFIVENSWSCNGYPTDFATGNYLNPLTLRLEPKDAAVQIAVLKEPTSTVDICSNFDIDLELRNAGNGDLINPIVSFDIPGDATSLILNGIDVEYPRNSGNIQTISSNLTGNTVTLNLLDHTAIAANSGIQGSLNAGSIDGQIAIIQLDLSVQCNFISNTAITYEAHGNNPCGTPATGDGSRLSTNPIVVTGAEPTYDAISSLTVPSGGLFAGCVTETVTVETIVVGGPTSNLDYARITLPDGLAFDPNSFTSNNPTYPVTYNSVQTVGNHEEFIVNMPDGATNGANPSYSFDLTPKNTTTTCSPGTTIQVDNYVVTSALTCGTVSCGITEIANGSTFENVIISKAELSESSFTSNADYTTDGSGNYNYHVEFGVENTGTIAIGAGFVYDVYCTDGTGVKTGASIYSGSIAQAIPAGNSISEDILFTTSSFCGDNANLIVQFLPSSTNCHCDALSIPIVSEPELADLQLNHTVDTPNANIGDSVVFTIEVSNQGPLDAKNIQIADVVPSGFTLVTINDGGTATGNTISWPTFDLSASNTVSFTFTATVNSPTATAGEYTSSAQVIGVNQFDPDSTPNNYTGTPLEDDEAIATVHVLTADLNVAKTIAATSNPIPTIGETVTFEVTISNAGPDTANNVVVTDIVPIGLTVDAASISNGGTFAAGTITWNIAAINSATNTVLSYNANVNRPTGAANEFTNIAQVTASDEYDPNSLPNNYDPNRAIEDDEAVYITAIQTSDLELTNSILPTTADPGDNVTVSIELTNNGPNDATAISMENNVPQGLTVTSIGNGGVQTGNIITWSGLNVPNGITITFTYNATVNAPTNVADEYLNTVQITAVDQYDLDSTPNNDDGDQSEDDEANAQLMPISADLSLTKSLSASSNPNPNTGDTITFEVTLTNNGPSEATNVSVEDIIPSGYTLGAINNGGLVTGSTISWNLVSVPMGTQTFTYEVTMNAPTGNADEYRNVAQVTASDQFDPNSTPNNDDGDQSEDDEASYTLATPTVDIEITKTADKTSSFIGDTVVFSITAVNNSAYEATNIGIEDILPPGFQLVSQTADTGTYDEASSVWQIPLLAAAATATLEMSVIVTETDGYTNSAQLAYLDQIDANMANDQDQVTIIITRDECLTVYNEFSPNGDGANEVFFIECIDQYPNNHLQIFNRWGTKVFEMKGYDNTWDGSSTGRATIGAERKLPVGTYYYTLNPGDGQAKQKAGWLYISR